MDFVAAVKACLTKYATFGGRASRPEFWWFALFTVVVGLVTSMFSSMLNALATLALLVPSIAVGTRRLHDIGKSGWFQLLALIPIVGGLVLLFFAAQPGEPQDNAYGPAPAGGGQSALAPGQQ